MTKARTTDDIITARAATQELRDQANDAYDMMCDAIERYHEIRNAYISCCYAHGLQPDLPDWPCEIG